MPTRKALDDPKGLYKREVFERQVEGTAEPSSRQGKPTMDPAAQLGANIAKRIAAQLVPRTEVITDRRQWIESKLIIRDKQRQYVPLRFNTTQEKVWAVWAAKGFKGLRHDIVKFRQGGISTLVLANFFEEARRVPGTNVAIVSRDAFEVRRKLQTIKTMWERLPDWERPELTYNNVNELRFKGLESTIWIGAAGNRSFGRGDTIHKVLCSELAFWPDAEKLFSGLQEAVPADGDIIIETTANGAGTWHHGHYLTSRDEPSAGWTSTFLPWFVHEEYATYEGEALALSPEEERVSTAFHLTVPQIRWRRQKKAQLKGLFPQEYPETDDEAFLFSGRPRFDRTALLDILKTCVRDPLRVEGELKVYADPVDKRTYTIGADTAEGIEGGDFDSAHVVDDLTGTEVATLHGHWPLDVYADKLGDLGLRYNTALLAAERNNTGYAVLERLRNGGENRKAYPRSALYYHQSFDAKAGAVSTKVGWPTDQVTKPIMTAGLETLVTEHPECFVDKATVSELLNIVYLEDGSVGAPAGAHDDRFISRAIVEQVRHGKRATGIKLVGVVKGKALRKEADFVDPRGSPKVTMV